MEAHHVQSFRSGPEGGMGKKVGDHRVVPMCSTAHISVHVLGQEKFELQYGIDLEKVADKVVLS